MSRAGNLMSYTALALFIAHEVDAVEKHEWRLLPILRRFDDEVASPVFAAIHVPLFVLLLWAASNPSGATRFWSHLGLDVYLVVHAGLHRMMEDHRLYEFHPPLSRGIIYGSAVAGSVHAALLLRARKRGEA